MAAKKPEGKRSEGSTTQSTRTGGGKRESGAASEVGLDFPVRETALETVCGEEVIEAESRSVAEDWTQDLEGLRAVDLIDLPPTTRKIIGKDDRLRLSPEYVAHAPFRWICSLRIYPRFGSGPYIGTGWLIGPRTIVTAGHCVFDSFGGGSRDFARSIEVLPAETRQGSAANLKPCTVDSSALLTTRAWMDSSRNHHSDIGGIVLPPGSEYGSQIGYFGFAWAPDNELQRLLLNISGYPAGDASQQYWHAEKVKEIMPNYFLYTIDTEGGQSGSAVYYISPDRKAYVVGIHTAAMKSPRNHAVRIDEGVFDLLTEWKNM